MFSGMISLEKSSSTKTSVSVSQQQHESCMLQFSFTTFKHTKEFHFKEIHIKNLICSLLFFFFKVEIKLQNICLWMSAVLVYERGEHMSWYQP